MTGRRSTHRIARLAGAALLGAVLLLNIGCIPFNAFIGSCDMRSESVTGTEVSTRFGYEYTLNCLVPGGGAGGSLGNIGGRFRGSYDSATLEAQELLTLDGGRGTAAIVWSCPRDPWIRGVGESFRCTRESYRVDLNVDDATLRALLAAPAPDTPYGAYALTDGQRLVLDSRLSDALRRRQRPAPAPAPAPAPTPRPTQPDLQVTRLSGPTEVFDGVTAVYEAALWNEGTAARGTAQIVLGFLGNLEPSAMVATPAGFTCTAGARAYTCVGSLGGVDDPISTRSAVFQVRGRATARGTATMSASANHDRALDESTVDNNLRVLHVTVK